MWRHSLLPERERLRDRDCIAGARLPARLLCPFAMMRRLAPISIPSTNPACLYVIEGATFVGQIGLPPDSGCACFAGYGTAERARRTQYHEIAEILELSIGTVMSRLFYARKRLKSLLRLFYDQV